MRKYILTTIGICLLTKTALTQIPELTVNGKANYGVKLQALKIDIKVCGTVATTTWQMTFKNNTNRILEGNLNFPLKDGISVSRYALDINGKMREAVPVERAKGTAVFETIERRRVDPGLLEKLDGNVFRTRIYPMPVNGTRTVIIGYEEELATNYNTALKYNLPLSLKDTVVDFALDISVIQNKIQPIFDSTLNENIVFDKKQNIFSASFKKNNYVPDKSLTFTIPKLKDAMDVLLQPYENKYCFLVNTILEKNEREKLLPKTIALLWDASLSGAARNTKSEIEFLSEYFKKVNNAKIIFLQFNNKAGSIKNYSLQNGEWELLCKEIKTVVYDGATNFGNLDLKSINADEFILVSDGHQTIGNNTIQLSNKPVYCVNSSTTADYSQLKSIVLKTGGQLIDLQRDDVFSAVQKITTEPLCFLGIKNREYIEENYPSMPVAVTQNFSLAGIAEEGINEIVLQFGYGKKITLEKTITINTEEQLCDDVSISKIYAQKKIAELDINYVKNKIEIESLGKQFGIITRNTSLIVLETLNDYLLYEIEPPLELRTEYQKILKQRQRNLITKKQEDLGQSLDMIDELKEWYYPQVKKSIQAKNKNTIITNTQGSQVTSQTQNIPSQSTDSNRRGASRVLTGKITDKDGNPIPFASVKIKGTSLGISCDANGSFVMRIINNDVVEIASAGYEAKEIRIGNTSVVNVILERNSEVLKEVVVTGAFGIRRAARSTTSTHQNIFTEQLSTVRQININNAVVGKVSGIQISSQSATLGRGSTVRLRGENSLSNNSGAIYVVDGVMAKSNIANPDDVENIVVLEAPAASALFGSEVTNGAIIITTKKFKPDSAYQKIQNKINDLKSAIDSSMVIYDPETTDYIKLLKQTGKEHRYAKYIEMRPSFVTKPTFFFEVGGYFLKLGDRETGLKILSNLAELENSSYELYKMLGYKLKEAGEFDGEVYAFKKVKELRPLDPQSFRDYALALQDVGLYQQSLDLLYEGMTKSYSDEMHRMYDGIEEIFLIEINRLIALHKKQLNLKNINKKLIMEIPSEARIVMNWNMNNTDIDLWVTDPNGEKCYYGNPNTAIGARMSDDFTEGFGPEQFMLKKGIKGKYKIQIDYFNDSQATIAGPTTIMAEIYLHYGTPNEERKIITLQMKKEDEGEIFIGEIEL